MNGRGRLKMRESEERGREPRERRGSSAWLYGLWRDCEVLCRSDWCASGVGEPKSRCSSSSSLLVPARLCPSRPALLVTRLACRGNSVRPCLPFHLAPVDPPPVPAVTVSAGQAGNQSAPPPYSDPSLNR